MFDDVIKQFSKDYITDTLVPGAIFSLGAFIYLNNITIGALSEILFSYQGSIFIVIILFFISSVVFGTILSMISLIFLWVTYEFITARVLRVKISGKNCIENLQRKTLFFSNMILPSLLSVWMFPVYVNQPILSKKFVIYGTWGAILFFLLGLYSFYECYRTKPK